MRLKIISDGTNDGTRIENAETGEPVLGVEGFEITGNINESFVDVILKCRNLEMEIIGHDKPQVEKDFATQVEDIIWKVFKDIQKLIKGEVKGPAAQIERSMLETYYKPGS